MISTICVVLNYHSNFQSECFHYSPMSIVFLPLFSPQLNSLGARERLSCLMSAEPSELPLEPSEALRITTEAYRLWAVAAGYGQACKLYM